jgi:serine protease Do
MKRQTFALVGLTAAVSFLLGLVAAGTHPAGTTTAFAARPEAAAVQPVVVARSSGSPPVPSASLGAGVDFATVAARLNAAVVNIDVAARGTDEGSRVLAPRRWPDDSGPREGSGSGFIIDPSGYILTNYHVIEGADRVTVTLGDGRVSKASIVGIDPAIDVALLQISARDPLPVAPLGNSDALRVGEWVCAIGNPLGFVHSVTVGVVSFLGRKVLDPSLDALIQTDAAITFGNSGGPLINASGEVVGITTAISAQAANIGFAVPIDQVIAVLPQLRERGRVSRGYIGVSLTNLTPSLRRALQIEPARGAMVEDVTADTPGVRAGLRPYDVVTAADGQPIRSDEDLIQYISGRQPGTVVDLEIWRDGDERRVPVKLTERPVPETAQVTRTDANQVSPASRDDQRLGLEVHDLDATVARRLNLPANLVGVVITDVDPAGPSRVAPVRSGEVLLEVNRQRITSKANYRAVVSALRPGSAVAVLVYDPILKQRTICSIVTDPQS